MPDRIIHKNTWIFDLDNTLYPAECNLFAQIDVHMGNYIQKLLGLGPVDARIVQKKYLMQYGTTLKGLMAHHSVDPDDFLEKVHDIDFSPISEDLRLREALKRIRGKKIIFTNANLHYAEQVIDRLGVTDQFEDIFDIHAADFEPKPSQQAYDKFISKYDINPKNSIMFEDMSCNLIPAHNMGMSTVWINTGSIWGDAGDEKGHIHYETTSLSRWLDKLTTDYS